MVMVNNYNPIRNPYFPGWYLLADSAVTNTGKPFYLPDFAGKTEVSLTCAVRISRLGKSIEPKFASRYYSEYAPALHFTLPEYSDRLKENDLPQDPSRSFDRSLFVGDFINITDLASFKLKINGEEKGEFNFGNLHRTIEDSLSDVTHLNTLKIGDLLVPGLSGFFEIKEGDFLEVVKGEERLFYVKVR